MSILTITACVRIPHGARVHQGLSAELSGGAAFQVRHHELDWCSSSRPCPVALAQLAVGMGWRHNLLYAVVPFTTPQRGRDPDSAIGFLFGSALGFYRQLSPNGARRAYGVGGILSASPAGGQVYAMIGHDEESHALDVGVRTGVAATFASEPVVGIGMFASYRVRLTPGLRAGVWFDAWLASHNEIYIEQATGVESSIGGGLLIERALSTN